MTLTAEELLAGSGLTHEVDVPAEFLGPNEGAAVARVLLRPLTVHDLQRIDKASREDEALSAGLMIQQAVVEPPLNLDQVTKLPAGLATRLISGTRSVFSTRQAKILLPIRSRPSAQSLQRQQACATCQLFALMYLILLQKNVLAVVNAGPSAPTQPSRVWSAR